MFQAAEHIALPRPVVTGTVPLEQLLAKRRSVRDYQNRAVELADIGQLLWAAQGITHAQGYRTAPSAGALYPLELYVVTGNVAGLDDGVYHYDVVKHALTRTVATDLRDKLARAAYSQEWIKHAAAIVVFTGIHERSTGKYGSTGKRYVYIETGHAAQNLFLQAEALQLATVVVGAFNERAVINLLQLREDNIPIVLMPIGHKR